MNHNGLTSKSQLLTTVLGTGSTVPIVRRSLASREAQLENVGYCSRLAALDGSQITRDTETTHAGVSRL